MCPTSVAIEPFKYSNIMLFIYLIHVQCSIIVARKAANDKKAVLGEQCARWL